MDYSIYPLADKEVGEIFDYYDEIDESLGDEFLSDLQNALSRVSCFPTLGRKYGHQPAVVYSTGFPYGLVYQKRPEGIMIVAVMHLHREPNYWVDRL